MAEHPIIFSTEMVRAILDGRKTQTRRIIKPQPIWEKKQPNSLKAAGWKWKIKKVELSAWAEIDKFLCELTQYCPYGVVGDRLRVKESYRIKGAWPHGVSGRYLADDTIFREIALTDAEMKLWKARKKPYAKTSGRFMYKSLARIFLEITNIRVERCKEISDSDIIDEGFRSRKDFYDTIIELNKHKKIKEILDSWFWVINFLRCQSKD